MCFAERQTGDLPQQIPLASRGKNHSQSMNILSSVESTQLCILCCFVGLVWLFLGGQNQGLISRLDCGDGLARPLDIEVVSLAFSILIHRYQRHHIAVTISSLSLSSPTITTQAKRLHCWLATSYWSAADTARTRYTVIQSTDDSDVFRVLLYGMGLTLLPIVLDYWSTTRRMWYICRFRHRQL